jgi:hypothetical protein
MADSYRSFRQQRHLAYESLTVLASRDDGRRLPPYPAAMSDSMDLVGDGDDVDIVRDVERVFGITISDGEAEKTLTVGQFYDLIERKCGFRAAEACLSQIAFYRLRRALREMGVADRIKPSTPISVIAPIGRGSVRRGWKLLARQSGLALPGLETSFVWRLPKWAERPLGIAIGVAAFCVLIVTHNKWPTGWTLAALLLGGPVVAIALHFIWLRLFGTIPRRIVTVGDLAREAGGHSYSYGKRAETRAIGRADRWSVLLAILRIVSGHKGAITRDTTFFAR